MFHFSGMFPIVHLSYMQYMADVCVLMFAFAVFFFLLCAIYASYTILPLLAFSATLSVADVLIVVFEPYKELQHILIKSYLFCQNCLIMNAKPNR